MHNNIIYHNVSGVTFVLGPSLIASWVNATGYITAESNSTYIDENETTIWYDRWINRTISDFSIEGDYYTLSVYLTEVFKKGNSTSGVIFTETPFFNETYTYDITTGVQQYHYRAYGYSEYIVEYTLLSYSGDPETVESLLIFPTILTLGVIVVISSVIITSRRKN